MPPEWPGANHPNLGLHDAPEHHLGAPKAQAAGGAWVEPPLRGEEHRG